SCSAQGVTNRPNPALRPTGAWRAAIRARHWRVWVGGTVTVGSWPRASSWARRRASSLSVLRLVCLNFQASLAVLATLQARPSSWQRSATQPARAQASKTTTAGRGLGESLRGRGRAGGRGSEGGGGGAPLWGQGGGLVFARAGGGVEAGVVAVLVAVSMASSCGARGTWGS